MSRGHSYRQLDHYPGTQVRAAQLSIVVLATIALYYELYIQGAVAPQIMHAYGMSFPFFVAVSIVGNLVGAVASLAAGVADRWGRANIVVAGLFLTAMLTLFGLPLAPDRIAYMALFALVSLVEGAALVATPALIRDFSPQVGRASAMGFWSLGPVVGSLIVTLVSSHTLTAHPAWQYQFQVCGGIGLVVFLIALVGLRELSPGLRNQLMVSARDKALIEARAAGVETPAGMGAAWRSVLKADILVSAVAISLFMSFYYLAVGAFVVYFVTVFGYTAAAANSLLTWFWLPDAIALIAAGVLSDLLGVRKPFMVIGAVVTAAGIAAFLTLAHGEAPGDDAFRIVLLVIAVGTGITYGTWMASYSETVERHNPAATATGLAVWGGLIRGIVTLILVAFALTMTAATTLVDHGERVQALAARYAPQLATLAKLDPRTLAVLKADPADPAARLRAVAEIAGVSPADVSRAGALASREAQPLATLNALAPPLREATLRAGAARLDADGAAVMRVARHFGITRAQAHQRLLEALQVPAADLAFLSTTGAKVHSAAAALVAVAEVPAPELAYLAREGPRVRAAVAANRAQWNGWWVYCLLMAVLFIPTVFLMAGRWSPAAARRDAALHRARVREQMLRLGVEP
jgi:MFS family permease